MPIILQGALKSMSLRILLDNSSIVIFIYILLRVLKIAGVLMLEQRKNHKAWYPKVREHILMGLTLALILLAVIYVPTPAHASDSHTPNILYIGESYGSFTTGIAAYGNLKQLSISEASQLTMNQLVQYDIIATVDSPYWRSFPELASKIGLLVSDYGKGFIALITDKYYFSPADAWISKVEVRIMTCELIVANTSVTQDVGAFKADFGLGLLLYGRYPLIYIPDSVAIESGVPRQGALIVYGYFGKGKYVVISGSFYGIHVSGNKGKLFSNLMYWLTDREIPPPPEFLEQFSNMTINLNNTINSLYQDISRLKSEIGDAQSLLNDIASLKSGLSSLEQSTSLLSQNVADINSRLRQYEGNISNVTSLKSSLNDLKQNVSILSQKVDDLTSKITDINNRLRQYEESKGAASTPTWVLGASLLSTILAIVAIAVAIRKH